nr:hypothetical protein [Tanacetum cinerariifolium]
MNLLNIIKFTGLKMEILLEPTSNTLLVGAEIGHVRKTIPLEVKISDTNNCVKGARSMIRMVPQEEKQNASCYVEPYKPPIPFGASHTEEALVHETIESLKKIRINRPLLKEIRHIDNYVKYMKDLVANKLKTKEDDKVRMNTRCSALLQNQLPPKEHDLGSFILSCSIGRFDFNNALADLGADISVIPFSMYKRLSM